MWDTKNYSTREKRGAHSHTKKGQVVYLLWNVWIKYVFTIYTQNPQVIYDCKLYIYAMPLFKPTDTNFNVLRKTSRCWKTFYFYMTHLTRITCYIFNTDTISYKKNSYVFPNWNEKNKNEMHEFRAEATTSFLIVL